MIGIPAKIIRDIIPDYLKSVPLPYSFSDMKSMSAKDWGHLLLFTGVVGGSIHYGIMPLLNKPAPPALVNSSIKKDNPKVVEVMKTSDMFRDAEKQCYCRCWKSKNWPYCDGSHNKHNEETGDNVGPILIKNE